MPYIGNVSGFDDVDTEQIKDGAVSDVKISDVDHSKVTGLATEISTAVSNLVDSSPASLNTLNELAAALGDDAAFSTTVTNSIATKAPLAAPHFTGQVGIGTDNTQLYNVGGGASSLVVTADSNATNVLANTLANITIANGDGTADNTAALHFAREDTDGAPNYAGASVVSQFKETQVTGQYPKADLAFLTSTSANSAPSEKMRISAAGNVGIGTSSPGCSLDITETSGWAEMHLDGAAGGDLIFKDNGVSYGEVYAGAGHGMVLKSYASQDMSFLTNADATARMTIKSSGNVGIGTSSPTTPLHATGTSNSPITTIENLGTGSTRPALLVKTDSAWSSSKLISATSGTADDEMFSVSADGRVYVLGKLGIGTNSPTDALTVNGIISGGFGGITTTGTLDWNHVSNARSGNGWTLLLGTATNGMGGSQYYHSFGFEYGGKTGTSNMTQWAIGYAHNARWHRTRYGTAWSSWSAF